MKIKAIHTQSGQKRPDNFGYTGKLGYDRLNEARKIGPSYAKSVIYIYDTYLICMELGPCISFVIAKSLSYSGLSYPSSHVIY